MSDIEPCYRAVGARVQMMREAVGMSQGELAKRVRLNRTSITNIEAGRQRLQLHTVEALASALGSSPRHIMKGVWT